VHVEIDAGGDYGVTLGSMPRGAFVAIVERMDELRVLVGVVAVIAAWAVYTVGAVPAATALLGAVEDEAQSAAPIVDSRGRPALRACYRVSVATNAWSEDEECGPWGGYNSVFVELCDQEAGCYEHLIRVQQRCVDRPSSCCAFLSPRPGLEPFTRKRPGPP
jgi:hypothetical protein